MRKRTRRTGNPKILITGGHATTALAVIEEIRIEHKDWAIVFIGRKYAFEGDRNISEEYRLVTERAIPFLALTTGRFARSLSFTTLASLLKIPWGFVQSVVYLIRNKPSVVVSFGGYIAFPVVISAWIFRIPVLTHEQSHRAGLANRVIAFFSDMICVSHKETVGDFPKRKTRYTGLPVRRGVYKVPHKPSFPVPENTVLIYVTGGITGAQSMNEIVFACIPTLAKEYTVIHQTGRHSFELARVIKNRLPNALRERYIAKTYMSEQDVAWVYRHAHIVIGRSGANTVGEIAALGIVAILIPLPWSPGDEQRVNALQLFTSGSAIVLDQNKLTPDRLKVAIDTVERSYETYRKNAQKLAERSPHDAARKVMASIEEIVP